MTSKTKTSFLFVALISSVIFIAGCKKSNASIVGTWTATSETEKKTVIGVTIVDTTIQIAGTQLVLTFQNNGYYSLLSSGSSSGGVYTLANSKLSLVDTSTLSPQVLNVSTLTSNALSLQENDTTSYSPLNITSITINLSR